MLLHPAADAAGWRRGGADDAAARPADRRWHGWLAPGRRTAGWSGRLPPAGCTADGRHTLRDAAGCRDAFAATHAARAHDAAWRWSRAAYDAATWAAAAATEPHGPAAGGQTSGAPADPGSCQAVTPLRNPIDLFEKGNAGRNRPAGVRRRRCGENTQAPASDSGGLDHQGQDRPTPQVGLAASPQQGWSLPFGPGSH